MKRYEIQLLLKFIFESENQFWLCGWLFLIELIEPLCQINFPSWSQLLFTRLGHSLVIEEELVEFVSRKFEKQRMLLQTILRRQDLNQFENVNFKRMRMIDFKMKVARGEVKKQKQEFRINLKFKPQIELIYKQKHSRIIHMNSRQTIEIIKTPNGYSILQNHSLINQSNHQIPSNFTPQSNNLKPKSEKQKTMIQNKKLIPQQQNFSIYPYIYTKQHQNHRYIIIPSRTQWFNLNTIHQIQRKELPEWFKQKKGPMAVTMNHMKFQKNQELYKKYRNYIIEMGKISYVSPTMARKGLAGDACAIIRIHEFLQKWGLINFIYKKPTSQVNQISKNNNNQAIDKNQKQQHTLINQNNKRKDGFEKDKSLISKIYEKDDMQLLKKITRKFRPVCDSCLSLCGIVWYKYQQTLLRKFFTLKDEQSSVKLVHSGQEMQYQITVCYSCYYERNFPVVLGYDDFVKKSLMQLIKQVDFDKNYGKKKNAELSRIADTVEKNKFNISKCSEQLNISQEQLLGILLQMPIQSLQKISRVQPETDDQMSLRNNQSQGVNSKTMTTSKEGFDEESVSIKDQQLRNLKLEVGRIDEEERVFYQEFLQAWVLKIYSKLEQLQKWDKSVQWRLRHNQEMMRQNIAQKLQEEYRRTQDQQ